ncbi:MAG: 2,3-bisphosphoglycerate-independent phosphoglycerate mutase [Nanoarchaeota archaeon]
MKKVLLLIMDGLGDTNTHLLNGKTPLQYFDNDYLNWLAENGETGLMTTIDYGIVPGSDTAHLAIFGYNPKEWYLGRGVYEALGAGINLKKGDLAFRVNVATYENGKIVDRRAGRNDYGLKELFSLFDGKTIEGVKVILKHTVEHRGVLVLRGKDLSPLVSENDPHKEAVPKKIKALSNDEKAKKTAKILNKLINEIHKTWENHYINKEREKKGLKKANYLLIRGAGILTKKPEPFEKKYGLKACCIAGGALYKGVAKFLGFDIIDVPGATGDKNTNLDNKVKYAIEKSKDYDFVFLHIKATDSLGHDGNCLEKAEFIKKVNDTLKKHKIHKYFDLIVVTGDHSTPCEKREHSSDPVPILIWGRLTRKDFGLFDEIKAALGTYRIKGLDLMKIILDKLDKQKKFGA